MITVNHIIGNIYYDSPIREKYETMLEKDCCESVMINRVESHRLRMRKTANKGTDVIFMFENNPNLRNGDVVFMNEKKMILLTMEPEYVGIITIKSHENIEDIFSLSIKIGHRLGNLHRPIQVTKNQVLFPLQAKTELEMLTRLFGSFNNFIDIKTDYMIFEPEEGNHSHEH